MDDASTSSSRTRGRLIAKLRSRRQRSRPGVALSTDTTGDCTVKLSASSLRGCKNLGSTRPSASPSARKLEIALQRTGPYFGAEGCDAGTKVARGAPKSRSVRAVRALLSHVHVPHEHGCTARRHSGTRNGELKSPCRGGPSEWGCQCHGQCPRLVPCAPAAACLAACGAVDASSLEMLYMTGSRESRLSRRRVGRGTCRGVQLPPPPQTPTRRPKRATVAFISLEVRA